mmetsp:Transcript_15518/g.22753  ORF Transcript_15518/g.22753 Transcript_15518/m.22753 type:complete len:202 (+) Transcript_15518:122-727(+)
MLHNLNCLRRHTAPYYPSPSVHGVQTAPQRYQVNVKNIIPDDYAIVQRDTEGHGCQAVDMVKVFLRARMSIHILENSGSIVKGIPRCEVTDFCKSQCSSRQRRRGHVHTLQVLLSIESAPFARLISQKPLLQAVYQSRLSNVCNANYIHVCSSKNSSFFEKRLEVIHADTVNAANRHNVYDRQFHRCRSAPKISAEHLNIV